MEKKDGGSPNIINVHTGSKSSELMGKIFKIALPIIAILVFVFVILGVISLTTQSGMFGFISVKVTEPFLNTGFGNMIKSVGATFQILFSGEKQAEVLESYSWKSSIDENSRSDYTGIEITRFESKLKTIPIERSSDEIEATAEITASPIEQAEVQFYCSTDNNKQGVADPEFALLDEGDINYLTVSCLYSKNDFKINENKDIDTHRIKFGAEYEFTTNVYLPIYSMRSDILKESKREVLFKDVRDIDNTYLTTSKYTKGPVEVILRAFYTQPLTEKGPSGENSRYILDLKIDDPSSTTTGSLKEITEINILTTNEINIQSLDLEYIGEEESGLGRYKLSAAKINELNDICKKSSFLQGLIDEDCWRRGDLQMSFRFNVNPGEILEVGFIGARVKYIYQDERQSSITFLNK
jgi:hypothetical protein